MVAVISQHHPNKSARHDDDDLDDDDGDYDGHDHDDALDDDDWVYRFSPKVGFGLRRFLGLCRVVWRPHKTIFKFIDP